MLSPERLIFNLQAVDINFQFINRLTTALSALELFKIQLFHFFVKNGLGVPLACERLVVVGHAIPVVALSDDLALIESESELVTLDARHQSQLHLQVKSLGQIVIYCSLILVVLNFIQNCFVIQVQSPLLVIIKELDLKRLQRLSVLHTVLKKGV